MVVTTLRKPLRPYDLWRLRDFDSFDGFDAPNSLALRSLPDDPSGVQDEAEEGITIITTSQSRPDEYSRDGMFKAWKTVIYASIEKDL